jgi:uncharacterized protein (TIGR03086 family)
MSQQHIDLWNTVADAFTQRYDAVTEEQWNATTPCEGWCVKDLVDHAVGVQASYTGNMLGTEIPEGTDWPTAREAIRSALGNDGALEGTTDGGPMGEVPKTVPMGIAVGDLLIHTWDLARAIGADEQLPAEAVSATYGGLQRFPEEMMRNSGMFGPAIDAPADADEQTKLLLFAGRNV